jgi:oxaloacetate decarboxylase gamma subunit
MNSGLQLTLYGMGTVFVFLMLLIGATRLMSWVVAKYSLSQPVGQSAATAAIGPASDPAEGELVAAIAAAVQRYRQEKK